MSSAGHSPASNRDEDALADRRHQKGHRSVEGDGTVHCWHTRIVCTSGNGYRNPLAPSPTGAAAARQHP